MDFKNCCLTCLGSDKEKRHINSVITISGEGVRLSDILQKFYNYKVPDEETFPQNICVACVHQLTITYSFKILIDSCAKSLSERVYKIESNDDGNECTYNSEEDTKPDIKPKINVQSRIYSKKNKTKLEYPKNVLYCAECKDEFHSIYFLKQHSVSNHPNKVLIGRDCNYCNGKFSDLRSLAYHRKLHFRPYVCESCWEGFFSKDDLNVHKCLQNDTNNSNDKHERALRQCDQCGKSYPPGYIRIHMLTHSEDRPYSCKFCPKKFKVPGGLHSHVLWNHKRIRNHKCEICNATFITASSRSSHIRKNHLKEKKYPCKCGKRFFSKSELERHMLTHTGVKNFHCHLCDKSYQTRYGLNVHLKSHSQMNMGVINI